MNFFDKLNDGIRDTEASVVNFLSAIAPWGAPLAPAYMTYSHMVDPDILDFPAWVAIGTAIVVEILGLSTVNTALAFWTHNKRNKANKNQSPIWIAVFSFIFYLTIIVMSNVILDASIGRDWEEWAIIGVRALFTLLSVPAVLIMAVRTQHQDLLDEIKDDKDERKAERNRRKEEKNISAKGEESNFGQTLTGAHLGWRKASMMFNQKQKLFLLNNNPSAIMEEFNLPSIQTASNWKKYAERDFSSEFDLSE